ncbi:MAG: HAD family phosphatase [Clostridia bacterium]|nr:HAD family phosphatase [Clostridia bacterium]
MIRYINIDLDGTLLKEHYIISDENIKAIKYAADKGVTICVNTGRNAASALYFSQKANMNGPVICCGGGLILDSGKKGMPKDIISEIRSREVLLEKTLPESLLKSAIETGKKTELSFYAQCKDAYYIIGEDERNRFMYNWDERAISIIDMGLKKLKSYDEFLEVAVGRAIKIGFSTLDKDRLLEIQKEYANHTDCNSTLALGRILELTPKGVNKGTAVEFMREHFGFSKDETACIGDDTNDIAMFQACGKSLAIANGCKEAIDAANSTVNTCEDNGVAEGIYRLIEK